MAKTTKTTEPKGEVLDLQITQIDPSDIFFDPALRSRAQEPTKEAIKALADSINASGQDSPIGVIPWAGDNGFKYKGIWGEHRHGACALLGIPVQAIVREDIKDDADILSRQWDENAVRTELTPLDRYNGVKLLMEKKGWNQKQTAAHLGKSSAWMTGVLAIGKCRPEVVDMLRKGEIAQHVAVALNDVPEKKFDFVLNKVKSDNWDHARIAEYVANQSDAPQTPGTPGQKPGRPKNAGGGQKTLMQVKDALTHAMKASNGVADVECTVGEFCKAVLTYVSGKTKIDAKSVFDKLAKKVAG